MFISVSGTLQTATQLTDFHCNGESTTGRIQAALRGFMWRALVRLFPELPTIAD
jgi:hypothetical protein